MRDYVCSVNGLHRALAHTYDCTVVTCKHIGGDIDYTQRNMSMFFYGVYDYIWFWSCHVLTLAKLMNTQCSGYS